MLKTSGQRDLIDRAARPVERYNSARGGLIHSPGEVNILKLDFASLHAALDAQTASDSLVVLHTNATSFYLCPDFHLTTLLSCKYELGGRWPAELALLAEVARPC